MNLPSEERQRLIEHGETALVEYFSAYRDRFERILSFRLDPRIRGRLDPADVLQESYLEISRRFGEYVEGGQVSLFVWMRQKVVQTLIDLQRVHFREKRDANREKDWVFDRAEHATSMSIARFLIEEVTSPSRAAMREEERLLLQAALETMQEIDREVLALRHFEQLSNQQVAEVLGISPTAASNRYVRAAARLGEILASVQTQSNQGKRNDGQR